MYDFEGKVAVVTGGASGIGAAAIRAFANHGAAVVIADVDTDASAIIVDELSTQGARAAAIQTDVFDEEAIAHLMAATVQTFGGLDVLMCSAGIPRTIAPDSEVIDMTLENWNKTIAGHLTGTMLCAKYALPHMIARGGGAIVNTSSLAGFSATADLTAYSAAKAGIHQLSREIAATYGRDNVRCNVIVPGLVLTPRGLATFTPEQVELFASETVLPRLPYAEDLANVALFLASDAAAMVTGQTITVDGGLTIKLPYWKGKMQHSRGDRFDTTTFKLD